MSVTPRLVVLDVIGTSVRDDGAVAGTLRAVLADAGVHVTAGDISRVRGASKRDAIRALLIAGHASDERAQEVYTAFRDRLAVACASGAVCAITGVGDALAHARACGARIALTTGLERDIVEALLPEVSPALGPIDAVVCASDVRAGRPAPYMIFRAMEQCGVHGVREVACVGDTPFDLQAAFNAGVRWNIGVLTGAHQREQLAACPHTHIVESAADLGFLFPSA